MHILMGPAASGKSSWAATYFAPFEIVSSDECRAIICGDPANQAVTGDAFIIFHTILEAKLRHHQANIVADATHLTRRGFGSTLRIADRYKREVRVVVFDTPLDTMRQWNESRRRKVPDHVLVKHRAVLHEMVEYARSFGMMIETVIPQS